MYVRACVVWGKAYSQEVSEIHFAVLMVHVIYLGTDDTFVDIPRGIPCDESPFPMVEHVLRSMDMTCDV